MINSVGGCLQEWIEKSVERTLKEISEGTLRRVVEGIPGENCRMNPEKDVLKESLQEILKAPMEYFSRIPDGNWKFFQKNLHIINF